MLFLLFLLLLIVGLVFVYQQLTGLTMRLGQLESRLRALERGGTPVDRPVATEAPARPPVTTWTAAPSAPIPIPDPVPAVTAVVTLAVAVPPASATKVTTDTAVTEDLETAIGSRWMLVVGTIVLVLGVAFFVKYAFDNHWINETTRIVIGTVVGLLVWAGGLRLVKAGYPVYGQVLAGGGVAMLYITAFAAHALYALVSPGVSVAWMAATSALTFGTADRQRSVGLALMAVILAYFAPLLVGRSDSHLTYFAYNVALAALTLALTHRHGWPQLGFTSLYLATMATLVWGLGSYTPDLYVSTEIYLVIEFVLFMAVLRQYEGASRIVAKAAQFVGMFLPVAFHVASLVVLGPHSVPLLGYLVLATTAALAVPTVRSSALIRLALWALVVLPFYLWLQRHTNGVWYIAALATSVGLYALHLLTQLLMMSETERPSNVEIALFHANGLALFLCLYVAVDANAGSTALVAALLAAWNALLAYLSWGRVQEGTPHGLALAFALAATSITLAFVGPWVTVGWAAEGAAIIAVGLAMSRMFLRVGGAGLLAASAARLVAYQFPVTLASHRPVFNLRVATAAFVIAMFYGAAALYRRRPSLGGRERTLAITAAIVVANALTVLLVTAEIISFWELREAGQAVAFSRQLSISLAWAMYALGLIMLGFRRSSSLLRYLALALFGLTVLKMFSIDLLELQGIYRIVGFIGLGLMLLGASFLYQRSVARR